MHFQPGESTRRGFLCDCEKRLIVCSSIMGTAIYYSLKTMKYEILSTKYKIKVCCSIKLSWGIRYYWQDYSALIFQNRSQMYYLGLSPTWGHGNQSIYSTTKLFLTELRSLLWWLTNRHFYFNFHCSVFITISQRRVFGDDWLEKDFCCIREWQHHRLTV